MPRAYRPVRPLVHEMIVLCAHKICAALHDGRHNTAYAKHGLYSLHVTFLISRVSYCIGQAYNQSVVAPIKSAYLPDCSSRRLVGLVHLTAWT